LISANQQQDQEEIQINLAETVDLPEEIQDLLQEVQDLQEDLN
jgi:hypothetical protein